MKRLFVGLMCLLSWMAVCMSALAEWQMTITQNMPVIAITTENLDYATQPVRQTKLDGAITYVDASVSVSACDAVYQLNDVEAQVKVRGNYTLEYPKKSIRIKFDQKQGMLGLHGGKAYKNWVLLAEWKDLSLMHSAVGVYLSQAILGRDGYYVTDCRNVEVWLNGEYWGVYLLVEQQEVKEGRTRLPEVGKEETGTDIGYFFEYDAYFQEEKAAEQGDPVFEIYHSGMAQEQHGYTIKSDIRAEKQKRFLAAYVRRAYQALSDAVREGRSKGFDSAGTSLVSRPELTPKEAAEQIVDMRSAVDMYILHEIICNPDTGWSSFYFTLDMSSGGNRKLTFEAPWDFDSAFGIRSGYESSEGWHVPGAGNPWLTPLGEAEWFQEQVRQRWRELKMAGVPDRACEMIQTLRDVCADSYRRNDARWPERIREGNHELTDEVNSFRSQDEAAAHFQRWLAARFAWLDNMWGTAASEN